MSTSWNLTRISICTKALQKLGAVGRDEPADNSDMQVAADALDGLLKSLPVYGYAWPQTVSGQVAVALVATVAGVALPSDYYGGAMLSYLDPAGKEHELQLVPLDEWNRIERKGEAGAYPRKAYIDPYNVLYTWPVQSTTIQARLVYQKAMQDSVALAETGLGPEWILGLIHGVAWACSDEFGTDEAKIARWSATWRETRTINIMARTFPSPYCISVAD